MCSLFLKKLRTLTFFSGGMKKEKFANYSPEEVLSGRPYGVKTKWGETKSKEGFIKEYRRQKQELLEELGR